MSLVRKYKAFLADPNQFSASFSAYESSSITDTSDFRCMVREGERLNIVKASKEDKGETVVVEKTQTADAIHPAPVEFTEQELANDAILRFFRYAHLPPALQERSRPFAEMARHIIDTTPRNAERTAGLRKLLEAKDCIVRAFV